MSPDAPQVVRLTPPGRGAIASLLVEGPGAVATVDAVFQSSRGRALQGVPAGRVLHGHLRPGTEAEQGEEVIVARRGEDSVEIHCHGGLMGVASVEQSLVRAGARSTRWEDWLEHRHPDPIQAAARLALADAATLPAARILLDQYHGALRRALSDVREALQREDQAAVQERLERVLRFRHVGLHLTRPWSVVFAGPPNAGKSSLINACLGYERAITDPTPGTTRDLVTATTVVDGWPLELIDTAGLRVSDHSIELAGIARAENALKTADLVLAIFERNRDWETVYGQIQETASGEVVLVHSKCDLPKDPRFKPTDGWPTSATTGEGVGPLLEHVVRRLVGEPIAPGTAVAFHPQQLESLDEAAAAAGRADWPTCRRALARLDARDL